MSGGVQEYVAAYLNNYLNNSGFTTKTIGEYDSKYFDVYSISNEPKNRILGDATGEMGPFYSYKFSDGIGRSRNHWYLDDAYTVAGSSSWVSSWFTRGGDMYSGVVSGQFCFNRNKGAKFNYLGSRLVLD